LFLVHIFCLVKKSRFFSQNISRLENEIDAMSERLPVLKSFILPGGCESATRLHLARVVCRRTERIAVRSVDRSNSVEVVGIYLNRLSDWLFTAARIVVLTLNAEEILIENIGK